MPVFSRLLLGLACLLPASVLRATPLDDALALYRARRYAEAQIAFAKIAAAEPGNAEAAYRLGRLALLRDDPAEAVQWLEKATRLSPRSSAYFQGLGDAYGRSAQKAGLFSKMDFARQSLAAYKKSVELDPQSLKARFALYNYYRQAPSIVGGGPDKARAEALEIQKLDAVRGGLTLARLDVAENDYEPAFATLAALRQSHPEAREVEYQIGLTAAVSGRHLEEGIAALKTYLAQPPGKEQSPAWEAHWRLGEIWEKKGDLAAARAEYGAALKLNPEQPQLIEAMQRVK